MIISACSVGVSQGACLLTLRFSVMTMEGRPHRQAVVVAAVAVVAPRLLLSTFAARAFTGIGVETAGGVVEGVASPDSSTGVAKAVSSCSLSLKDARRLRCASARSSASSARSSPQRRSASSAPPSSRGCARRPGPSACQRRRGRSRVSRSRSGRGERPQAGRSC